MPPRLRRVDADRGEASDQQAQNPTCNLTRDELKENGVGIGDACPSCFLKYGHHQNGPIPQAAPPAAPKVAKVDAYKMATLVKDIKWKKSSTDQISRLFFQAFENKLTAFMEYKDVWPKILPGCMEDPQSGEWVKENIALVEPPLNWEQSKLIFGKHFDLSILQDVLRQDYKDCRQGYKETVQSYSQRFQTLCSQLEYKNSDDRVIQDYVDGLKLETRHMFKTYKINQSNNPEARFNDLVYVMNVCITSSAVLNDHYDRGEREPSGLKLQQHKRGAKRKAEEIKKCINHPDATSHTTAQCKSKAKTKREKGKSDFQQGEKRQKTDHSKLTCFNCNQPGHISPNCPQPKSEEKKGAAGGGPDKASATGPKPGSSHKGNQPGMKSLTIVKKAGKQNDHDDGECISEGSDVETDRLSIVEEMDEQFVADLNSITVEEYHAISPLLHSMTINANAHIENSASLLEDLVRTELVPTVYALFEPQPELGLLPNGHNELIKNLSDSGCSDSAIDLHLVETLGIPIEPRKGSVLLAENSTRPRIGKTKPIWITFYFWGDLSNKPSCPPIRIQYAFEVVNGIASKRSGHQMMFGRDLMKIIADALERNGIDNKCFLPFAIGAEIKNKEEKPIFIQSSEIVAEASLSDEQQLAIAEAEVAKQHIEKDLLPQRTELSTES